jgi:hypothetical protein
MSCVAFVLLRALWQSNSFYEPARNGCEHIQNTAYGWYCFCSCHIISSFVIVIDQNLLLRWNLTLKPLTMHIQGPRKLPSAMTLRSCVSQLQHFSRVAATHKSINVLLSLLGTPYRTLPVRLNAAIIQMRDTTWNNVVYECIRDVMLSCWSTGTYKYEQHWCISRCEQI